MNTAERASNFLTATNGMPDLRGVFTELYQPDTVGEFNFGLGHAIVFKDDSVLFGFETDKGLNLVTSMKDDAAETLFLWGTEHGKVHELLESLVTAINEIKDAS